MGRPYPKKRASEWTGRDEDHTDDPLIGVRRTYFFARERPPGAAFRSAIRLGPGASSRNHASSSFFHAINSGRALGLKPLKTTIA
jgi:hypothetical protein